jgi:hypothetical protein
MNKDKISVLVIVITVLSFISSCSVSQKGTIAITKPLRNIENMVSGEQEKQQLDEAQIPKIIAIAKLSNETDAKEAPAVLRAVLQSHLSNKNFQLIHTKELDLKDPDSALSVVQLAQTLGADAILTGKVTEYERFYAGIYAHIKLGVSIELISKDGVILWQQDKVITSRAGGVSLSPWGLLMNAALAALHLEDSNLFAAADELGRTIAKNIPQPSGYIGSDLANIDMVIHDGANKWLKYGDKLSLGIKGDPGLRALVEIEGLGSFDLKEQDAGYYHTEITVDKRWNGGQKVVNGKLVGNKGQVVSRISSIGLVNFDNQKPVNVSKLNIEFATPEQIKFSWQKSNEQQVSYQVIQHFSDKEQLIATSEKTGITITGDFTAFEQLAFSVVAIDRAKNKSNASHVDTTVYPLKLTNVIELDSLLSGEYRGVSVLSKKNSPYVVTEHSLFTASSTLLIEPGVTLKFKQSSSLTVQGNAYFWGKKDITFINESSQSPAKTFLILDSNKTVEITGLTLNNAGLGVDIKTGTPVFKDFIAKGSKYSVFNISGSAKVELTDCHLNGSSSSAIIVSGRSRLQITNCLFANNKPFHIQNVSPFAVLTKNVTFDNSAVKDVLGPVEVNK